MSPKEIDFDKNISYPFIRVGSEQDVGISISPRNDNMFLWLGEELYFQNNTGRLFKVEFKEIEVKEKRN
jgi:hypothetical protein